MPRKRESAHRLSGANRVRQIRLVAVPWDAAPDPGIFGGMTEQKNEPGNAKDPSARGLSESCGAILPLRSDYPSPSCVPAEPGFVSPDSPLYLTNHGNIKTSKCAYRLSHWQAHRSGSLLLTPSLQS